MRNSLKKLIENAVLLKYRLPNNNLHIPKTIISTKKDDCFSVNDNNLAEIIYNAVIDYAFNEYEITRKDLDDLHAMALSKKIHFPDSEKQQSLGFYGEIFLYCILYMHYSATPIISRGYFYNILENTETKGYDSYHFLDNDGKIELWFGEVKFYIDGHAAVNSVIDNLEKALSDDYLNKNLIAISEKINDLADSSSTLKPLLEDIKNTSIITINDIVKKYDVELIYPILLLFDKKQNNYNYSIEEIIKHINKSINSNHNISKSVSLFFILVPVDNTKNIKLQVLEWIEKQEPLI